MLCPGCQNEFDEKAGRLACNGCVAKAACGLVRCPNCGYETVRQPHVFDKLKGWFRRPATGTGEEANVICECETETLADLQPGRQAIVKGYVIEQHLAKFLSLGILPGTSLLVIKTFPAFVVQVGYSQFAFDRNVASTLEVHPAGHKAVAGKPEKEECCWV